MVEQGQLLGFLHLDGRDQLRIQTGSAEVEKVITITRAVGPGTPTGGNFRLFYQGYYTDVLPYNSTAAAIELAIEALEPFQHRGTSVIVSAALTSSPVTITWGGQLADEEPEDMIFVDSLDINDGTDSVFFNSSLTTEFQPGFPTGSNNYVVNVFGVQAYRLNITQGEMKVFSS